MAKKLKMVVRVIYVVILVMVAVYMFMGLEAFSRYLEMKSVFDIWPQAEDVLIRCICVFFGVTAVVCFIRMVVIDFDRQRLYDKLDYAGILASVEDDEEYEEVVHPDEDAYEAAYEDEEAKRSKVIKKRDKKKEKACMTRAEKFVKKFRAKLLPWPEEIKDTGNVSNKEMKSVPAAPVSEKKSAAKPASVKPALIKVEKVSKPATTPATTPAPSTAKSDTAKQQYIDGFFAGYSDLFE